MVWVGSDLKEHLATYLDCRNLLYWIPASWEWFLWSGNSIYRELPSLFLMLKQCSESRLDHKMWPQKCLRVANLLKEIFSKISVPFNIIGQRKNNWIRNPRSVPCCVFFTLCLTFVIFVSFEYIQLVSKWRIRVLFEQLVTTPSFLSVNVGILTSLNVSLTA